MLYAIFCGKNTGGTFDARDRRDPAALAGQAWKKGIHGSPRPQALTPLPEKVREADAPPPATPARFQRTLTITSYTVL